MEPTNKASLPWIQSTQPTHARVVPPDLNVDLTPSPLRLNRPTLGTLVVSFLHRTLALLEV
jgi:hypothetical protein